MALTDEQQQVLQHARDVLNEAPRRPQLALLADWYQEVRSALAYVAAAFPADYVEQPAPDAGDSDPGSAS